MNSESNSNSETDSKRNRYSRQIQYSAIGEAGQARISGSTVLLVGCGALGCVLANTLVRAGVGKIRLLDRDWVELTNLQRQSLFTEKDVADELPKAIAASRRLAEVNSTVEIEPHVIDFNFENAKALCEGVDLILDGTDNFEARFLINDASHKFGIPWVYGGCLGSGGQTMTILPGKSACLNCLMLDGPPPPGTTATCDTAGVLEPIISLIASIQAMEALKILSGNVDAASPYLQVFDMWGNRHRQIRVAGLAGQGSCPTCGQGTYDWLAGRMGSQSTVLCGRNAVQLSFIDSQTVDLEQLEKRLEGVATVVRNKYYLRADIDVFSITVFPDGRAIVKGTEEIAVAKRVYSQYVGG
jgi:adenylyltransferase/sulfurtransferase